MAISPSDYVSQSQHEIFATDINKRIEALKAQIREVEQDEGEPFVEDVEELAELVEFREAVERETGKSFEDATIVPDDEFQEHARDWAYGIGDFEFLDAYVDWEKFADDLRGDRYTEMDFGSYLVYVR